MPGDLAYIKGAERPDTKLWIQDDDGTLIDFHTGYTFTFKIGRPGAVAILTKTSGITGAVGSGTETSGTPNVTITYSAGELDFVSTGGLRWQLTATTGGLDRSFQGGFTLSPAIT
jgi:hypothetical protein